METSFGKTESGSKASTTSTNNNGIELEIVCLHIVLDWYSITNTVFFARILYQWNNYRKEAIRKIISKYYILEIV